MRTNLILHGHTLTKLKKFPNESINCIMTSPPYWALRDYGGGLDMVWDERCDNCQEFKKDCKCKKGYYQCEHEWDENIQTSRGGYSEDSIVGNNAKIKREPIKSNFCQKCGAWKGQLGLEPTFDLYIKHLCNIFDEVKRVLRKDGTCWINIGDTYWGGGQGGNDYPGKQVVPSSGYGHKAKGISYSNKSLVMIPFRFAIEMVNRGWILRNTIIWHKPNCMPSSVKDRFTVDFEYLFFFTKNKKYYFETQYEPIKNPNWKPFNKRVRDVKKGRIASRQYRASEEEIEKYCDYCGGIGIDPDDRHNEKPCPYCNPKGKLWKGSRPNSPHYRKDYTKDYQKQGRNKRSVWKISTKHFPEAHFAVYPEELCETPIKAGCPPRGIVLDPFAGAGTTGIVAKKQGKKFILIDLNKDYIKIAKKRLK